MQAFSVPELLARVNALAAPCVTERVADVLSFGDIAIDREKKRVSRSCHAIDLGPTEYSPARIPDGAARPGLFASNCSMASGAAISTSMSRTVDVHVGRLRKALNRGHDKTDPHRARTGYALDDRFGKTA